MFYKKNILLPAPFNRVFLFLLPKDSWKGKQGINPLWSC